MGIIEKTRVTTYNFNLNKIAHKYFCNIPGSVKIDSFTYKDAGYINKIEFLIGKDFKFTYNNIEEFVDKLIRLKESFDLKRKSDLSKDIFIIYTDEFSKLYCFLHNYDENISRFHEYYFTFLDNFEFRNIKLFNNKKLKTIEEIQDLAENLFEEFIADRQFYITPTQMVTKKIKKNCDNTLAKEIYPENYILYTKLYKSYFGGLCICNYPGLIVDEYQTVEYDRTSAYIFELICQKHACEPLKATNTEWFEYYIDNEEDYFALALININISGLKKGSDLFKDVCGNKIKPGNNKLYLTNTDFKVLKLLANINEYECLELYVSKKDYLPEDLRKIIIDFYLEKIRTNTKISKVKVNSIYGACVKKITDFVADKDSAYLAPQWGILTTSYARYNLLMAAINLNTWLYSDTDSIFCKYSVENVQKINDFNHNIREKIKYYCLKFNENYSDLQNLGTFKKELILKKFKANGKKQYMYTDVEGNFTFKGSGINGYNDESAYDGNINTGKKEIGHFNPEYTEANIDGKIYYSNGSYYSNIECLDDIQIQATLWLDGIMKRRKL